MKMKAMLVVFLFSCLLSSDAFSQQLWEKRKKYPNEDFAGYLGRIAAGDWHEPEFPGQDGLSWSEREKKYGFTVEGIDRTLPILAVFRPFEVYFKEQKSIDYSLPLYGKAQEIYQAVYGSAKYDLQYSVFMTPDELHRSLAQLAEYAASEALSEAELGIDCRYKFHAIVGKRHSVFEPDGPQFDFNTKSFVGELNKDKPTHTTIVFIVELLDPTSHELMLAANDIENLPEHLKKLNGPKLIWKFPSYWAPDSFSERESPKESKVTAKFEKRSGYEFDANLGVIQYEEDSDLQEVRNKAGFARLKDLREKIDWTKTPVELKPEFKPKDQVGKLAFLVQLVNERQQTCEAVWVVDVTKRRSSMEGTIDNHPITSTFYTKGSVVEFSENYLIDIAYLDGKQLHGGETIRKNLQQITESDGAKLKRQAKFDLSNKGQ